MRIHAYQIYPVVALAALAGATVWLERVTAVDEPRTAEATTVRPDLIADNTRLVSYGSDGRQRYELLADEVVHYTGDDVTTLTRPRLRYQSEGREVRITADTGRVSDGGQRVDLSGQVQAERAAAPGGAPLGFTSNTLTVWPDDQRAETHDPVVLTRNPTVIHAAGLKADNLFGKLDLLGNVRVHMPRSRTKTP